MFRLLIISSLFFVSDIIAQQPYWNTQLLSRIKVQKVVSWEQPEQFDQLWFVKVKTKKKYGMYMVETCMEYDMSAFDSIYVCGAHEVIPTKYDKIDDFKLIDKEQLKYNQFLAGELVEVAEAYQKKKKGIIAKYGTYDCEFVDAKDFFDEIDWERNQVTYVPVMRNDLWGIYDWYGQRFLFECEYPTQDDLPRTTDSRGFDDYSAGIFRAFNKQKDKDEIDMIDMDGGNGDGLFKARSRVTKKWGLYQYLGDQIVEAIPMEYDSLYHFPWNGNYTAVFNDGKVGFYLSYWSYNDEAKQSVECKYEDYKRYITDDQIPKLAVKRDGKWGWVDWLTGEERSEFKYETPDDLPYPYYVQKMWLDE